MGSAKNGNKNQGSAKKKESSEQIARDRPIYGDAGKISKPSAESLKESSKDGRPVIPSIQKTRPDIWQTFGSQALKLQGGERTNFNERNFRGGKSNQRS